jgi:hypothetical protein
MIVNNNDPFKRERKCGNGSGSNKMYSLGWYSELPI